MTNIEQSCRVFFVQYTRECEGQALLIALDGGDLPDQCELRFANQSNSQKLVYDCSIGISGQSDTDRHSQHLRTIAFRSFRYRFLTDFQTDSFECLAVADDVPIEETRLKVDCSSTCTSCFDLPLFQLTILESSHDALGSQPFLAPLTIEQLRMARSIPIQSGDCLIIDHKGIPACLMLQNEIGDSVFEGDFLCSPDH